MNTITEGVCVVHTDGRILFVNPAASVIMGWTADALVGQSFYQLLQLPNSHNQYDTAQNYPFQPFVNLGLPIYHKEAALRNPDGQLRLVIYSVVGLNTAHGEKQKVFLFQDVTDQKQVEQTLLLKLKQRLAQSREDERIYLAQELHDGPIQDLYALSYQLQALKRLPINEEQNRLIENIHTQFQQVSETIRDLCQELRPPTVATFGLGAAIRAHAERFAKLYPPLTVTLELDDDQNILPENVRLTLFRICQEMLSNVARHAQATHVLVRFEITEAIIILEIQDNGCGFEIPNCWADLTQEGHLGMVGASERAAEINGHFLVLSNPGEGTIIRITAPFPKLGSQRPKCKRSLDDF